MIKDLHVVIGLGQTGLSVVNHLVSQGLAVAVMDSRQNPPHLTQLKQMHPDIPVILGQFDAKLLDQSCRIIISPGISLKNQLIAEQLKKEKLVIGDIELFAQSTNKPIIGITGTNAKSTVTTLVGEMAFAANYQVKVGGNLGIPALDLLNEHSTNLFVLELSSFQLETVHSLKAKVATVLNVSPDHMDRYDNLSEYQAAKLRIYQNCEIAVCNGDDPLTDSKDSRKKIYFSINHSKSAQFRLIKKNNEAYLAFEDQALLATKALPIAGKHYYANALAALAIGYSFGLAFKPMLNVLKTFRGLPHRCQFVKNLNDVHWYNDSKGTNVGATVSAIFGLGAECAGKIVLIAGGVGKNADFSPLLPVLQRYVRHVVLMGEAAKELAMMIGTSIPCSFVQSMEEAIVVAKSFAYPKDFVLLSPACASFDMFDNFEHRGDVFTQLVQVL